MSVLIGAGAALVILGLGLFTRRVDAIPIALVVVGALHVIPDDHRPIGTVIYGSGLLLTAELAYWSIDEHGRLPVEWGVLAPRLLAIFGVAAASLPASALVLLAADLDFPRSSASTAAGATAIVACVALLAALARARGRS